MSHHTFWTVSCFQTFYILFSSSFCYGLILVSSVWIMLLHNCYGVLMFSARFPLSILGADRCFLPCGENSFFLLFITDWNNEMFTSWRVCFIWLDIRRSPTCLLQTTRPLLLSSVVFPFFSFEDATNLVCTPLMECKGVLKTEVFFLTWNSFQMQILL